MGLPNEVTVLVSLKPYILKAVWRAPLLVVVKAEICQQLVMVGYDLQYVE